MTTTEMVKVYINQLCAEIGTTSEAIYNANDKCWYFTRGSVRIEMFMTSYETVNKQVRTFIRLFSPIYPIPADNQKKLDLYQGALEANAQYMGVKLATIAQKNYMYAVSERDIEGMDYMEFTTMIGDLGYWADKLDDFLKETFGVPQPSLN